MAFMNFLKKKKGIGSRAHMKEHHFVFVEALFDDVVDEALKWSWSSWWPQDGCLHYELDGEFSETGRPCRLVIKTRFLNVVLRGEMLHVRPRRALQFSWHSGLIQGQEFLVVEERSNGTRIDHRTRYYGSNILFSLIWALFFRKRYDACIARALDALKFYIAHRHDDE